MLHDKSSLVLLNKHVKFQVQYFFLLWQRVSDVEENSQPFSFASIAVLHCEYM